jgi:hypothetical protein
MGQLIVTGWNEMWRPVAVGVSVVAAAASGVVTALVTAHSSWGLWVALVVLVVVGAVAQAAVSAGERRSARRISASGAGAVAVGGSAGEIRTQVRGEAAATGAPGGEDVVASGPGAVGVGGDAAGPISTDVSGPEESAGP